MTGRLPVAVLAAACGIAVASLIPEIPQAVRYAVELVTGAEALRAVETRGGAEQRKPKGDAEAREEHASIRLTDDQIEAAGIELAAVQDGTLSRRIVVPGTIVPHADRIARVSVKLSATVTELRKKLGDTVAKGEVIAVLESREVANAKSEYLAARLNSDLQKNLYERDKILWDRHVMAEQLVLRSRGAAAQAKVNLDIARQKLFALGVTESELAALPDEPEISLRRQEVHAPISGRVVDRKVDLGAAVGRDNLETELFTVADLDRVWVELAIGPTDLPMVAEGQTVSVAAHGLSRRAVGKIVFISPIVDRDTHSARVVAEITNPDGNWRPGSLVHAAVAIEERSVALAVPVSAIQTIDKMRVLFVRTSEGFEKRQVMLGDGDDRLFEVLSGARDGETIAVSNTFALKAEFLKSLAED
ncbi:MAG TPA: efflux RND transporter periplasmic adaptor subunit [Xanthobacteraceae bacterium]|jgi:cobalt-zinc-cadmium efflux system membrane fusion protein|nr:efflux RND transporter periplasmic adaptor subunit [Xanthobacteraceae bacterium]